MKGGVWRTDFFSRQTGLNAWLHELMSRKHLSSRSASSQKVEESLLFFLLMLDAQERPFLTPSVFESYIHGLRLTSSAQTEKNWSVRGHRYAIPPLQTSPIPQLLIKILHYCPHVQHACCIFYSSSSVAHSTAVAVLGREHCAVVTVHCSRLACTCAFTY